MTTVRDLCRGLAAALQVPGVERHAARLVRVGYLPRSGDEDDAASTGNQPATGHSREAV